MKITPIFSCITIYALIIIGITSCLQRNYNQNTKTNEALSEDNNYKSMGISTIYSWDDLKKIKEAQLIHPWSDTYWPLQDTGLSARWMLDSMETQHIPLVPGITKKHYGIFTQLNEMNDAIIKNNQEIINVLSPAEKYDLLLTEGKTLPTNILQSLKNQYQTSIGTLPQKQKEIETLKATIPPLMTELIPLNNEIENLNSQKVILQNTAITDPSQAAKVETEITTIDAQLKIKIERADTINNQLDAIYEKKEVLEQAISIERKQFLLGQYNMSQGEIAKIYPMFASGWREFSNYSATYSGNWSWMGHCHGWSPASLIEKAPKHGVIIKTAALDIFFSEGDIRGLLTKVWAEQSTQNYFGGTRCSANSYNSDRRGRILDGVICYNANQNQQNCKYEEHSKDGKIIFIRQQLKQNGKLTGISFVEKKFDPQPKFGLITNTLGTDNYWMNIYNNINDYNANKSSSRALVKLSLGCRDVNPALLHLALHDLIAIKKTGFIMDQTRDAQVWNQPTYAYKWETIPILKNNNLISAPDEIVPIEQIIDPFKYYRASGTRYLVQIKNSIKFGKENGPKLTYTPAMDFDGNMNIVYTLELNEKKELIGGEWGLIPIPREVKNKANTEWMGGRAPDFIWRPVEEIKPINGQLNYNIISKIHDCSLDNTTEKRLISGQEIDVSICRF